MKKLIIASLTVLTTLGVSGYTSNNLQAPGKVTAVKNQAGITGIDITTAADKLSSGQIGRADLAQVD